MGPTLEEVKNAVRERHGNRGGSCSPYRIGLYAERFGYRGPCPYQPGTRGAKLYTEGRQHVAEQRAARRHEERNS